MRLFMRQEGPKERKYWVRKLSELIVIKYKILEIRIWRIPVLSFPFTV